MKATLLLLLPLFFNNCIAKKTDEHTINSIEVRDSTPSEGESVAYFASGCFWCVEAIYESVLGVSEAVSGYSGGGEENPTYDQVARGMTTHAEAVQVFYNSKVVSYETLVHVFYGSHDPTTLNRQGPDRGAQYRSILFYSNDEEKKIAQRVTKELANRFDAPIVTEIVAFKEFHAAEAYHQNFEVRNPQNPYVQSVSIPRLKRFQAKFPELLKKHSGE